MFDSVVAAGTVQPATEMYVMIYMKFGTAVLHRTVSNKGEFFFCSGNRFSDSCSSLTGVSSCSVGIAGRSGYGIPLGARFISSV
jgi:hypothetical protein